MERALKAIEDPCAQLERDLISDYIRASDVDPADTEEAGKLLKRATQHASEQLALHECRAHYTHTIHGAVAK